MKKTLNTSELESQLAGSVFFRKDKPQELPANQPSSPSAKPPNGQPVNSQIASSPLHTTSSKAIEPMMKDNKRSATPNERTDEPNGLPEQSSLLNELEEGVREVKRGTERYSFEIFTDQKGRVEDLQYRYKKKTGRKLSSSRIIREALDAYLKQAEGAL